MGAYVSSANCQAHYGTFSLLILTYQYLKRMGGCISSYQEHLREWQRLTLSSGVTPNCSVVLSKDNSTALFLGEVGPGQFPGDPDIAGIGVRPSFPLPNECD
jgi:hypothetical protein